jgi:transcription elongation GreA/GreB family factor
MDGSFPGLLHLRPRSLHAVRLPEVIADISEACLANTDSSQRAKEQVRLDIKAGIGQHIDEWQELVSNPSGILDATMPR